MVDVLDFQDERAEFRTGKRTLIEIDSDYVRLDTQACKQENLTKWRRFLRIINSYVVSTYDAHVYRLILEQMVTDKCFYASFSHQKRLAHQCLKRIAGGLEEKLTNNRKNLFLHLFQLVN
ncbi:hypothetical protein CEXT_732241 [Caerostris extrusa]|uniref:Uncharacterized protein n=1 Tax=Caerostris extrusa TaxID=172846 RepID=A0AAV4Y6P3_CAEEX|nr:hypothetical protein CEXT_732241 [Caerostris extrusa]